jgi:hypothetical protein
LVIVESDDEQKANVVGKEGEASLSFKYPFDDMDLEEPLPPHEDEPLGDGNGTANGKCVNECDADCISRRICFVVRTVERVRTVVVRWNASVPFQKICEEFMLFRLDWAVD